MLTLPHSLINLVSKVKEHFCPGDIYYFMETEWNINQESLHTKRKEYEPTMARNNGSNVKIPKDVERFANMNLKKWKKKEKFSYESKKECIRGYYDELLMLFPETVKWVIKYGYLNDDDVKEMKSACFAKYVDADFISTLAKAIKKDQLDDETVDAVKIFPIVLKEVLEEINKENARILAEGKDDIYDSADIIDLCRRIFSLSKKKLKKFEKAGIDESIVFDIMCAIPCNEALTTGSTNYRIRVFYDTIYELAKCKAIPFGEIMDIMIPEKYITTFVMFALLERKEKFGKLNDAQKKVYSDITKWAIQMLENSSKDEIRMVIETYTNARKRDESRGKDSPRRYTLKQISEVDYPRIAGVIKQKMVEDPNIEKYLV